MSTINSVSLVLMSWVRWLRGDSLVRSREEACRAVGIEQPEAVAFAIALGEAAHAFRERRDPAAGSRAAKLAYHLAASALAIVGDGGPALNANGQGNNEREAALVARGAIAWSLTDAQADQAASETLAEFDRRLRPYARTVQRFALARAVAHVRLLALALACVLAISIIGGFVYIETRPRNLLSGRPFRTSSASREFDAAAHTWLGTEIPVFFVTDLESDPWIEYDFGRPTALRRITVENRPDCCRERAAPLVLELSDDRKAWRELDRIEQEFLSWDSRFALTKARYLRLRVPRTSMLHLASVQAYDK